MMFRARGSPIRDQCTRIVNRGYQRRVCESGGSCLHGNWGSRVSFSSDAQNKGSQLGPENPQERKERYEKELRWRNDRLKLDEEKTQYSKEGVELSREGLDLDKKNLALSRENLALSRQALTLDKEKLSLEKWHLLMVFLGGAAAIYTYSSEQYRRQLDELNQDAKRFVAICRELRPKVEFIESQPRGWLLNVKIETCHQLGTELKNALSESENVQRRIRYLKTTWLYRINGSELDKLERRLYRHHYDLFVKVGLSMNDAILYHRGKNYKKGIEEISTAKSAILDYLRLGGKLSFKDRNSVTGSASQEHRHHLRLISLIASLHNLEGMIQRKAKNSSQAEYQYLRALSVEQFADQLRDPELWKRVFNLLDGPVNTVIVDPSDGPRLSDQNKNLQPLNVHNLNVAYILSNLGFLYNENDRHADALKVHDLANRIAPNNPAILNGLGFGYLQIGAYFKADQRLRQARYYAPTNDIILSNLAWLHYESDRYDQAIKYATQAIKVDITRNKYALYYRGIAHAAMGEYEESQRDLAKAMLLCPDHDDQQVNLKKAINEIKSAERQGKDRIKVHAQFENYPSPIKRFVSLHNIDSSIRQSMMYSTDENLTGRPIEGYPPGSTNCCILRSITTEALKEIQADLSLKGLSVKIFDCYRPQRAVDQIMRWVTDSKVNSTSKARYYPCIEKSDLQKLGYIDSPSNHSRGLAVDLTIINSDNCELDMGTPFDYMDPKSSHAYTPLLSEEQQRNRKLLLDTMKRFGFEPLETEWWHYVKKDDLSSSKCPPPQYFDFEITDYDPLA